MSSSKSKIFETTSFLSKSNSSYIEEMYEKFIPEKLNQVLNEKIKKEKNDNLSPTEGSELSTKDSVRAIMMIRAYRIRGHLNADLDPLQLLKKEYAPELDPKTYGFSDKDLNKKNRLLKGIIHIHFLLEKGIK